MSLAIHLADANSLNTVVPLEPRPARLDSRWDINETKEFLEKARQFVKDTNFETFFILIFIGMLVIKELSYDYISIH